MSDKRTFIYRVEMGHHPDVKEITFCYARNKDCVLEHMKTIFKDRHYNMFRTYKLGETDPRKHPGPFEILPKDEEQYLRKIRSTVGEEYADRRRDISRVYEDFSSSTECGDAVQQPEGEPVPTEGERIPDPGK